MKRHNKATLFQLVVISLSLVLVSGCLQAGSQASPGGRGASGEYLDFNMGGIAVKLPLPAGYAESPPVVRQSASLLLNPPENLFAVYSLLGEKVPTGKAGLVQLQNRKLYTVSARPEFIKEFVDQSFFTALRRDLQRLNGTFGPERLQQFRVLTNSYYAKDDSFTHSLGVYSSSRQSVSIVRIVRQPASRGSGAVSAYPAAPKTTAEEGSRPVLSPWDKTYFSRAYQQVSIQNVIMLNGRYFNIYFTAPLADEADIYAAMQENKAYMDALARAASTGELGTRNENNQRVGQGTVGSLPQTRSGGRAVPAPKI